MFYLALLPTLLDLTRVTVLGYAELVGGDAGGAGGGVWRLYRAGRPRPQAFHESAGHPDPQPDDRRDDGGARPRRIATR